MTDMQAAVGRVQLTRLAGIVEERRRIAAEYSARLAKVDGVTAPAEPSWARTNWQSYCVELAASRDQRAVMQRMLDEGVSTRRGVMNSHLEEPYRNGLELPSSERAQQRGVILPLAPSMTQEQVEAVCGCLAGALEATVTR
jgi:dTDP-4-amino-4,6-dideoxygalactose transaminase